MSTAAATCRARTLWTVAPPPISSSALPVNLLLLSFLPPLMRELSFMDYRFGVDHLYPSDPKELDAELLSFKVVDLAHRTSSRQPLYSSQDFWCMRSKIKSYVLVSVHISEPQRRIGIQRAWYSLLLEWNTGLLEQNMGCVARDSVCRSAHTPRSITLLKVSSQRLAKCALQTF